MSIEAFCSTVYPLVFWLKCPVWSRDVDASSKIDFHRLKVEDLLIKISVHSALLGLVFLVLGRS